MRWTALLLIIAGVVGLAWDAPQADTSRQAVPADTLQRAAPGLVMRLRLDNVPITPVSARFIERGIREAEDAYARCLVIELDTPGGLMESTQHIVKDILASRVPVAVYVAPSGARAASAGVFITLAGHVAAMAPGTHIGAAHPVSIGGVPGAPPDTTSGEQAAQPSVMEEKIVNDAMAWARSLAEMRGRNAEWAALSVSESRSITGTEALEEGVVDLLADDLNALLTMIDGREVMMAEGTATLRTEGAAIEAIEMWWGERLLEVLSNPNLAFLLLIFGFYGILFEFYSPGWGVSGTLGAICLVLGFFGMSVLPVNYAGLILVLLGLGLFVAEAFFSSFGALTLGGAVCLILGGLMLFDSPVGLLRVSIGVVLPVALATAVITFFLMGSVVKAMRGRVQTGAEDMIASTAIAQGAFVPTEGRYQGMVLTHGELWKAVSPTPIAADAVVEVKDREGLMLFVAPANTQTAED